MGQSLILDGYVVSEKLKTSPKLLSWMDLITPIGDLPTEQFQILFYDGSETQHVLLASQLSGLINGVQLKEVSVVQLLEYIGKSLQNCR